MIRLIVWLKYNFLGAAHEYRWLPQSLCSAILHRRAPIHTHRHTGCDRNVPSMWKTFYGFMWCHAFDERTKQQQHTHTYTRTRNNVRNGWAVAKQHTLTNYEAIFEIDSSLVSHCALWVCMCATHNKTCNSKVSADRVHKCLAWKREFLVFFSSLHSRGLSFNVNCD